MSYLKKYAFKIGGDGDGVEADITIKKKLVDDYYEGTILGQGGFGSAMLCEKETENNAKYVIKMIDLSKIPSEKKRKAYDLIMNEIFTLDVLRTNCEQYVMCYIKTFIQDPIVYIVCEYLENYDTLDKLIRTRLPRPQKVEILANIFSNLLLGLEKIHSFKICHRDIKPGNIMYNNSTYDIKYIDFGLSALFIDDVCRSSMAKRSGTHYFAHPELALTPISFDFLKTADRYSLGMTFFVLLSNGRMIYEFVANNFVSFPNMSPIEFYEALDDELTNPRLKPIYLLENEIINYAKQHGLKHESFAILLGEAIPETFLSPPETFLSPPETLPSVPETLPSVPETLPSVPETLKGGYRRNFSKKNRRRTNKKRTNKYY